MRLERPPLGECFQPVAEGLHGGVVGVGVEAQLDGHFDRFLQRRRLADRRHDCRPVGIQAVEQGEQILVGNSGSSLHVLRTVLQIS